MQRMMIAALLMVALTFLACGQKAPSGEESMEPKQAVAVGALAEGTDVPEVMPGDEVLLELTVYHPRYVYLTGGSPVEILPPRDTGLEFKEKRYRLTLPRFPLVIPFKVTRDARRGAFMLKLGMRVTCANKADDSIQIKHVLLQVPLKIVKRTAGRRAQKLIVPLEHFLQVEPEKKKGRAQ